MKKIFMKLLILVFVVGTVLAFQNASAKAESLNTNKHFYNQLSAAEKKHYNVFIEMATKKKYQKTIVLKGTTQKAGDKIFETMVKAKTAFSHDWPQYPEFELTGNYFSDKKQYQIVMDTCWINPYELAKAEATLEVWAKNIDSKKNADRYTKVKKIWNLICSQIKYDHDYEKRSSMTANENVTIIGGTLYGKSICEGYMRIFKALCDKLNVPCLLVGNDSHGWNLVQMEDGKWYSVDVTDKDVDAFPGLIGTGSDIYKNGLYNASIDKWYIGNRKYGFKWPKLSTDNYKYTGKETDFSVAAQTTTFQKSGKLLYVKRSDGKYKVFAYYGEGKATVKVPAKYKGKAVVEIGPGAFAHVKGIKKVVLPKSVKYIDMEAFGECPDLQKVNYRCDAILESNAFYANKNVGSVYIPDVKANRVKTGINIKWTNINKIKRCKKLKAKFSVYRKATSGKWEKIATVSGKKCSYTDKKAKKGTKYKYAISMKVGNVEGDYSNSICKVK